MLFGPHALMGRARLGLAPQDAIVSTAFNAGNGVDIAGPDLLNEGGVAWLKPLSSTGHFLFNTVRGADRYLETQNTNAEAVLASYFSFKTNGCRMDQLLYGGAAASIAWLFRQAPGYLSVVTWTGDGVSSRTVSHTLGSVPSTIIMKRTDSASNWVTLIGTPASCYIGNLNTTGALTSLGASSGYGVTSTTFQPGQLDGTMNTSGGTYVGFVFGHDMSADGFVQAGTYTGNGSATGPTVNLNWTPQRLMIKRADTTGDWWRYDTARSPSNPRNKKLLANSSAAEDTSGEDVDFLSTGFQLKASDAGVNASGGTYAFFAERAPI